MIIFIIFKILKNAAGYLAKFRDILKCGSIILEILKVA